MVSRISSITSITIPMIVDRCIPLRIQVCPKKGISPTIQQNHQSWEIPYMPSLKLTAKAPENRPGPKRKIHLPTIHFQVLLLLVLGWPLYTSTSQLPCLFRGSIGQATQFSYMSNAQNPDMTCHQILVDLIRILIMPYHDPYLTG